MAFGPANFSRRWTQISEMSREGLKVFPTHAGEGKRSLGPRLGGGFVIIEPNGSDAANLRVALWITHHLNVVFAPGVQQINQPGVHLDEGKRNSAQVQQVSDEPTGNFSGAKNYGMHISFERLFLPQK